MAAPLLPVTIAFMAGVLAQSNSQVPAALSFLAAVCAASAFIFMKPASRLRWVCLLALWFFLGIARMALWQQDPAEKPIAGIMNEPRSVLLHAVIESELAERGSRHGQSTSTATLQLRHHYEQGRWLSIQAKAWLELEDADAAGEPGDEVLIEGVWFKPPAPTNPGQYDWRSALERRHIHSVVRVKRWGSIVRLEAHPCPLLFRKIAAWRRYWKALIAGAFSAREAALLSSFLLGERASLEASLEEAFVETGTMHLLVVSGFNVALIAGILEVLLRLFGLGWQWRPWLAALGVGGYCLLTGMQPPVVRAGLMAWVVLGAAVGDHVVSWPNTLAAAALLMLGSNPAELFDPSFQLSCGAVACLLIFTPRWQGILEKRLAWISFSAARRWLAAGLAATTAVWIGLWPLLAWYFHLITPVSLAANLIVAPLVSLLIVLATPLLLFSSLLYAPLLRAAAPVLSLLLEAIIALVMLCRRVPGGSYAVAHAPLAAIIGYYALLAASWLRKPLHFPRGWIIAAWLLAFAGVLGHGLVVEVLPSRRLRLEVLDVGHGDSLVVRTPRHHVLVIDCGSQQAGQNRLVPFLRYAGISAVDALVLTHTDEDHLGGAIALLERVRVKRLLTNGVRGDTMAANRVWRLAARRGVSAHALMAGQVIPIEPGLKLEALHPPKGGVPGAALQSNDNCVVLKLTFGDATFLFTADIEERGLPELVNRMKSKDVTVLKVPHHGSRLGAIGRRFFKEVRPEVAIISVGRLHGLPAEETLQALQETRAAIYSTRIHGAVSVETDGHWLRACGFRGTCLEKRIRPLSVESP